MDYDIYWDEKKQKGVELYEIDGIRYLALYVNYSAWIEDIEGNGDAEISIDYRAEDFSHQSIEHLMSGLKYDNIKRNLVVEDFFDRSGWEFGMNE